PSRQRSADGAATDQPSRRPTGHWRRRRYRQRPVPNVVEMSSCQLSAVSYQLTTMRRMAMLVLLLLAAPAQAADAHLRVIVPRASVRSGPAFTYRELYRAERGEVMRAIDRNGSYWFRVVLPDGRFGWIYGEQVLPFEVEVGGSLPSRAWAAFKEALFSPSPIPSSSIAL